MPAQPSPSPPPVSLPKRYRAAVVFWSVVAGAAYGFYSGQLAIPGRFNPWAPLDVMAPPDWLTPYKLERTRSHPQLCLDALAQTGMAYDVLPDRTLGPGCSFENAVRMRTASVRLGVPLALSCPMALSFYLWERHSLQPAAMRHFGQRVLSIDSLGSYACRNINQGEGPQADAPGASRSRHATANALDIAGFTLENAKRITVLKDWQPGGTVAPPDSEAQMLADVHAGACRFFNGVLGPDYNAVHRNHFHLETGGYRMCR